MLAVFSLYCQSDMKSRCWHIEQWVLSVARFTVGIQIVFAVKRQNKLP